MERNDSVARHRLAACGFAGVLAWTLLAGGAAAQGSPVDGLAFVENQGQWESAAVFVARAGRQTVRLEPGAVAVQIAGQNAGGRVRGALVRLVLESASGTAVLPEGEDPLEGTWSFFRGGDPARWRSDVPAFASALYRGVAPGIDVRVREQDGLLEYDVLLAPDADPGAFAIRCEGADALEIDADGALVLCTSAGTIRQAPPTTWEETPEGERRRLECRYRILDGGRFGFELEGRDPGLAVVVDPGLEWSTYLGGSGQDMVNRVVVEPAGTVLVAGLTEAPDFPVAPGAFQPLPGGHYDAFVARLSADGTSLLQATFLGGSAWDEANGLAVVPSGAVALVGRTSSADWPATTGAFDTTLEGQRDAFVAVLDPGLGTLLYSTYLGGGVRDWATNVAFDGSLLVVSGATESANFPVTAGAFDTTYNFGSRDHFVARLDPSAAGAAQLVWSTYLGGSGLESPETVLAPTDGPDGMIHSTLAVAPNGDVLLAGSTWSADFPVTPGALQTVHGGANDAYVARLSADGSTLLWSTFLGGTSRDAAFALALGPSGSVMVAGRSRSADFPTTPTAFQAAWAGTSPEDDDGILAWIDATGSTLLWSTYFGGGGGSEWVPGLAVDSAGRATVSGFTGAGAPVTEGAYQTAFAGGGPVIPGDAFVARLDPRKSGVAALLYGTYFGGTQGFEIGMGIGLDTTLGATIGGLTGSGTGAGTNDLPVTPGAFQPSYAGDGTFPGDGFVARLDLLPTGVAKLGASKGGCVEPLAMGVTAMPKLGASAFAFTVVGAVPSAPAVLGLSLGALAAPLPVLGVDLWIHPAFLLFTVPGASDALGYVEIQAPIPAQPLLAGVVVHAQILAGGCGTAGLASSNALTVTIQP